MPKFNVGDIVKRVKHGAPQGLPLGAVGIISGILGCDIVTVSGYSNRLHLVDTLELVGVDDPLPPAPESVLYIGGAFPLDVAVLAANKYHSERIRIGVITPHGPRWAVLEPDDALQLAHDLNRMANEIKRKEKQ